MQNALYAIVPHDLTLDNDERRYILRIRDLADHEKPRERLIAEGPEALSTSELLAVVLSTGTTKEEIMTMSARIMKEYGERSIMREHDPKKLAAELNIPVGKALQIVAAAELGRRFFSKNENGTPTIRTPREVFEYVIDMRTLPREHLRGLYLNTHYKVIHDEVISIGTLDANIIHPREVYKPALEYSAAAVILVHNHPSGDPMPSPADITVTDQIARAGGVLGIDLIDHVIVTRGGFMSVPMPQSNA